MASVFPSFSFSLFTTVLSVYSDAELVLHTRNSETARKACKLTCLMTANVRDMSVRYFHNYRIKNGAFPLNREVNFYFIFRPLFRLQSNFH